MRRCFLLAALLFSSDIASASDVIGLRITAFGIEGAHKQQQGVTPLQVEAKNNSVQAITATIRVYQADMTAFARPAWHSYVRTVTLQPSGTEIFDVPLRLSNLNNTVLYAEALDKTGMPLGHATQRPGNPTDGKLIGLFCATDEVCKSVREKILFSGTAEEQTRKSQDLRLIQLKRIPPHWWAYVPLDTVVLAASTAGFNKEEADGLEAFVLGGGRLVLAEKEIGERPDTWPKFAGARSSATKATLTPFGRGTLVKVASVGSAEFSNFFRPYGFAVSTPADLVKQFAEYREPALAEPQANFVAWLQERTATHFRFPSPLKLILWMTAYLALMIVVSFVLPRRFGRPEVAWVTIPVLAILFAAILYEVSAKTRPTDYRLDESRYYQMDAGSTLAMAASEAQISSPRKGSVRLAAPGEFIYSPPNIGYAVDSLDSGEPDIAPSEIALGESWETNVFLRVWSSKTVTFEFVHRFPGSVVQTDSAHLLNSTGVDFEDAMLVTKDTVYLLGAVSAGASIDLQKAKHVAYKDATGYRVVQSSTPPFAFGQGRLLPDSESEPPDGKRIETHLDTIVLSDIILGWPNDGNRVFFETKAVFFGKGKDVVPSARLGDVPAQQKSAALYCVTYRNWK